MKCEYCGQTDQNGTECEWCGAPISWIPKTMFGYPVIVSDVLKSDEVIIATDWERWIKTKGTGQSKS